MRKLHFHSQDYEGPWVKWQVIKGKEGGKYRGVPEKVNSRREQQTIPKTESEKSPFKQLNWKTIADDESREASIRQRVRKLENNLLEEYGEELGTIKASLIQAN